MGYLAYLYLLIGVIDHSNQHVEQHHHHSYIVDTIQHITDVLYELVVVL